jgi:hypothetical protein
MGLEAKSLRPEGFVEHVLSHRRLRIRVLCAALGRRRRWPVLGPDYDAIEVVPLSELASRGHAAVTRKILAAAGLHVAKVGPGGLRSS